MKFMKKIKFSIKSSEKNNFGELVIKNSEINKIFLEKLKDKLKVENSIKIVKCLIHKTNRIELLLKFLAEETSLMENLNELFLYNCQQNENEKYNFLNSLSDILKKAKNMKTLDINGNHLLINEILYFMDNLKWWNGNLKHIQLCATYSINHEFFNFFNGKK